MKDIIKEFKISKATTYSGRRYNLFLFDYGYEDAIDNFCGYLLELNRFAENVDPPTAFYPQINFSLLIQAVLFYNTSR